jgi:hypothetical protein
LMLLLLLLLFGAVFCDKNINIINTAPPLQT